MVNPVKIKSKAKAGSKIEIEPRIEVKVRTLKVTLIHDLLSNAKYEEPDLILRCTQDTLPRLSEISEENWST